MISHRLLRVAVTLLPLLLPLTATAQSYVAETRTLTVDGSARTFVLAKPSPMPVGALPLVISMHGDGGDSAGMRSGLPIETAAAGQAVFVYPKSRQNAFEYWNHAGRTHEGLFVQQVIATLQAELGIDSSRVYLAGFSGGATMANALGCRLGRNVIRGLGIHSGSLYPVQVSPGVNDFGYTGNGGVNCAFPRSIMVWGQNDNVSGVSYQDGLNVLGNVRATHNCAATTTPSTPSPCVAYTGCTHDLNWCPIAGLGHSIWGSGTASAQSAARAMWDFFAADAPAAPEPVAPVFSDGFESGGSGVLGPRWVMGYYVGYERALQTPAQIDFSAITHLMLGRVTPNANGTLTKNFDIDDTNGPIWAQSAVTAARAANRKVILMVGGAGEINGWRGAASPANRATFVSNLLATVDQFNVDGIDLDWEPIATQDHANLLALAQALRAARPDMLLTLPVEWLNTNFLPQAASGYPAFLTAIAPVLDRVNVMSYEMAADYQGWHSWFASPLAGHAANTPSSVASSVQYYVDSGVPAAKIGVGIGFYGNCFKTVTQPRQPVVSGNFAASDGTMSYRNIEVYYRPSMTAQYDLIAQAPWLSSTNSAGPVGCNLVTYENPQSIAAKATWARQQGLGGAIIWTLGQGYVPENAVGNRNPLLDAVRQGFLDP